MLFCILPNECHQPYSYTGSAQVVRYGPYSPREGVTTVLWLWFAQWTHLVWIWLLRAWGGGDQPPVSACFMVQRSTPLWRAQGGHKLKTQTSP